ncbi:MAG: DctP family TRAP transporter solute-binding subunit, partial [Chromatiales bacterium]|nr:DctP family TRAP transporter solute-binding subunit [Chromatiales bacterium]
MNRLISIIIVMLIFIVAAIYVGYDFMSMNSITDEKDQQSNIVELRLGHNIGEDSALHAAALRFANEINRKSDGQLHVTVYPNQELGNDHKMIEMARNGELDLLLTPTAKLSLSIPEMQYADLPFYFNTRQELYSMLDGRPGDILLKKMERIGLIGITFWENGFKHFTSNYPMIYPEDFVGKKMRTMKSKLIMEQFKALDAKPIPIDFHATYQALKDGVVDGQENPLVAISNMKFYEVQKYLTLSSHGYLGYAFSASSKRFEVLPLNLREMIMKTARELTNWERIETQKREKDFLKVIVDNGVQVHTMTKEQYNSFSEKMGYIPRKFESVMGAELIAETEEIRFNQLSEEAKSKFILLGVNADLGAETAASGVAIRRGVELAVDQINHQGGVLGKKLKVISKNHDGVKSKSLNNMLYFSSIPELVAVVGGKQSHIILNEIDTVHNKQLPYLIPWAAASTITNNGMSPNYIFRVSAKDQDVMTFLLDYAVSNGNRRVTAFVESTGWGRSNEAAIKSWLRKHGDVDVNVEHINRGTTDFSTELRKSKQIGATAIILALSPNESAALLVNMEHFSMRMPIYSHWGLTGGNFWTKTKHLNVVNDVEFVQTVIPKLGGHKKIDSVAQLYRKFFSLNEGEHIIAPSGFFHAYELTWAVARAIELAQSINHEKFRSALENIGDYKGVIHNYHPMFSKV